MKRTEFRLLPVPAELFDELGFTEDMTLEAFVEDSPPCTAEGG